MPGSIPTVINLDRCTGCRTCEIACSFHHNKSFDPARSSIQVSLDRSTGAVSINFDSTCDGCSNEEEPLCLLFCPRGVFYVKRNRVAGT